MKFILLLIFALLITVASAIALDECEEIETAGVACEVVTPVIACSTYDTYTPSHALDTDDGAMTQIGSTGIYYFTFNETTHGNWIIHLCSNHTAVITIDTTSIDTWIKTDANIVQDAELDAVNASIMAELSGYSSNATFIGVSVWEYNISGITEDTNTAGGFMKLVHTIVGWIENLI